MRSALVACVVAVLVTGCCNSLLKDGLVPVVVRNTSDATIVGVRGYESATDTFTDNLLIESLGGNAEVTVYMLPAVYDVYIDFENGLSRIAAGLDLGGECRYVLIVQDGDGISAAVLTIDAREVR